jgi:uncharacterized protein YlxW (UPF0749 family)
MCFVYVTQRVPDGQTNKMSDLQAEVTRLRAEVTRLKAELARFEIEGEGFWVRMTDEQYALWEHAQFNYRLSIGEEP